eukprot:jgi/Ulvmu1/10743/UM068_0033.1
MHPHLATSDWTCRIAAGTAVYQEFLSPKLHLTRSALPGQACVANGHRAFADTVLASAAVQQGCSMLRWTATFLSQRQLEHVGTLAQQQGRADPLACCLGNWRELAAALPATQRFDAIVAVNPVTVCLLPGFFEPLASRLARDGDATVRVFYAAPAIVAAERRSSSFFKNEMLRGAELPTREEVASEGLRGDDAAVAAAAGALIAGMHQQRRE